VDQCWHRVVLPLGSGLGALLSGCLVRVGSMTAGHVWRGGRVLASETGHLLLLSGPRHCASKGPDEMVLFTPS
jgi:hypothetical protein